MNLYVVKDVVAQRYFTCFFADEDNSAVRDNLPMLCRIKPYQDIELYNFGSIDIKTGDLNLVSPLKVDTSTYHFSEVVMEDMKKTEAHRQIEFNKLQQELAIKTQQYQLEKAQQELEDYRKGNHPDIRTKVQVN